MGFFGGLFKSGKKPQEGFALGEQGGLMSRIITFFGENTELPDPLDFIALAEHGFRRNAIVHACIRRISQSVAEPQLKALTVLPSGELQTDSPQTNDPLAQMLYAPNEEQDQFEMFEQLLIHLMVAGNGFIYKVRSKMGGPPIMLELIRPDLMGIIPGKNRTEGHIKAYTIRVDQNGAKQMIDKRDIIHFKMPDAFDEFWGLSPLYTASRHADIDLQASDFLRAYFRNRGIPSGLLTFDKPVQKTERDRVRELWKEQFQGLQGWHNVAVLDAKATYTPLSTGVEKMNLDVVTAQTETRICMIFGVPPVLIGSMFGLSKSTFSNLNGSEKIFWTDTMGPMFSRISRKLTRKLAQEEFGQNRQAIFDLSSVSALTENKSEIRKIAIQGWRAGLLTRNASNKMLGIAQEDVNGNVYLMTTNMVLRPADQVVEAQAIDDTVPVDAGTQPSTTPVA